MKKSSLIALITIFSLVLNPTTMLATETDTPVDLTVTVPEETPVDTLVTLPEKTPIYNSSGQDETIIPDPSSPTDSVVSPIDTSVPTEPVVSPIDTSVPTEPTTSSPPLTEPVVPAVTETPTTEPGTTSESVLPTDSSSTTTNEEPKIPESLTEANVTEGEETVDSEEQPISSDGTTATVPTIDGGTATIPTDINAPTNNPNISAQAAQNAGASQVGTTSRVTGQIVSNVTQDSPITTHTGHLIISTVNSQVVIQGVDGMVSTVDAEVVGGKVNADKTISVKTASGDMTTLPSTGEKENFLMSLTGLGLLAMVGHYLKKRIRQA